MQAGAQHHHDENDIEHHGDGADGVHNPHHDVVHSAAEVAGNAAVEHAHDQVYQGGHHAHQQGDPGAVHHADEQVAAQGVGAPDIGLVQDGFGGGDLRPVVEHTEAVDLVLQDVLGLPQTHRLGGVLPVVLPQVLHLRHGDGTAVAVGSLLGDKLRFGPEVHAVIHQQILSVDLI